MITKADREGFPLDILHGYLYGSYGHPRLQENNWVSFMQLAGHFFYSSKVDDDCP